MEEIRHPSDASIATVWLAFQRKLNNGVFQTFFLPWIHCTPVFCLDATAGRPLPQVDRRALFIGGLLYATSAQMPRRIFTYLYGTTGRSQIRLFVAFDVRRHCLIALFRSLAFYITTIR